ncbi:META domain-containing protein [Gordonia rubripertincta]|uniref:DUF306 domain-containing protein n=1 Tax=Gordonia rubripertincta NBRC 101908 TaxID=1077975 RepID=A0ABQ0HW65_GORRU|nr:hypothetical protein GORBP_075_00110 [Gordonia rubripertincta NBRC 101908]
MSLGDRRQTARVHPAREHRISLRIVALVSAVLFVSGLGAFAAGPGDAEPAAPPFVGKSYSSTAVTGPQIPGGGPLQLTFTAANRISLFAGCNRHVGEMTVEGSVLRVGSLASTMMACPGPRAGADEWITALTSEPLTWYSVGHALVLSGPGTQVLLTEKYS